MITKKKPHVPHDSVQDLVRKRGCSPMGEYKCQVPMPLNGRRREIDICIADIVAALNAANIITVCSCCGHGFTDGLITLKDGRALTIKMTAWDRLVDFLCDDEGLSPEQVRSDLEADGVDVDAFLDRIGETIKRHTPNEILCNTQAESEA